MNYIFWDTNLLLDLLARPDYSDSVNKILKIGNRKGIIFCISFLSVANFAYILRKNDKEELYNFLRFICQNFKVLKNDANDILKALEIGAKDFEDAIQYETALAGKCDCIITRNKQDFYFSKLPIFTPEEFINSELAIQ